MRCAEFEENLSAYLEGLLCLEQAERMEFHALQCSACRDTLTGVAQVCQELNCLGQTSPSASFKLGLWSSVQDRVARKQQAWWRSLTLGLALAVALLILLWPEQYSEGSDPASWETLSYPETEWVPAMNRHLDPLWSEKLPELSHPGLHSQAQVRLTSF